MNSDSPNFDSLRRLLSLKRHEQPPPGHFDRFSRDVMARIKAGERGGEIGFVPSWWERLTELFVVKPAFAGAFGMAVCALLVVGVISSERVATGNSFAFKPSDGNSYSPSSSPANAALAVNTALETSSTNPVAVPSQSLFDRFQIQPEQASWGYEVPKGN